MGVDVGAHYEMVSCSMLPWDRPHDDGSSSIGTSTRTSAAALARTSNISRVSEHQHGVSNTQLCTLVYEACLFNHINIWNLIK